MDIDYEDWINQALKDRRYELDQLETAFKDTEHAWDKEILLEAVVDHINWEVNTKTMTRSVRVTDPPKFNSIVNIFIPQDFPLAFGEYSRVLILGVPRRWKRNEDDEDYNYSVNGISLYPIPKELVEPTREFQPEAMKEDEEGENLWEG